MLDCDIEVNQFELQLRYYVHFRNIHIYQPLRSGKIYLGY